MPVELTSKHIVLFGAGKSSSVLIDYLKQLAAAKNWHITVADNDLQLVQQKVGTHKNVTAASVDVTNTEQRKE